MTRLVFNEGCLAALLETPNGPVGKELQRRGQKVANQARSLSPVDTGRLRASIQVKTTGKPLCTRIGTDVEYSIYLEMGTRYMSAQPYLVPALEAAA